MTTSNYPDIMFPAYQQHPLLSVPFVLFLLITMFLLLNFLLAIIYSKFKGRLSEKHESLKLDRMNFLRQQFSKYSSPEGDYLDVIGMYKYFVMIHCVVHKKTQDMNFDLVDSMVLPQSNLKFPDKDIRNSSMSPLMSQLRHSIMNQYN